MEDSAKYSMTIIIGLGGVNMQSNTGGFLIATRPNGPNVVGALPASNSGRDQIN